MDKIVALCKNRGFVYAGSEIYGGLANSWDYGPLGVEFKNNVKKAWLKKFVQESPYNVGLDAAILMNPQTWVTTGHVSSFSDPLLDCKACKARHRADKLIGEECPDVDTDAMTAKTADIHSFNGKFSRACGSGQRVDSDLYVVSFGAATKDLEYMAVIDFATGEQLLSVTLDNPQDFTYRCVYFE